MTCRQLRKWIPVSVDFVHKIQILLGLRESQEFIRMLVKSTYSYTDHFMGIVPYQCKSHLVTQPRPIELARIPFSVKHGYDATEILGGDPVNLIPVMEEMFQKEDAYHIIRAIIGKEFNWVIGISTVLCQLS